MHPIAGDGKLDQSFKNLKKIRFNGLELTTSYEMPKEQIKHNEILLTNQNKIINPEILDASKPVLQRIIKSPTKKVE